MGTAWDMPIAVIGKPTGDGRQFDEGALSHRDLPLPLRYVATDSGGHNNAVIVGHIAKIGKEKDGMLPAKGEFYDDESWPDDVRNAATAAMKFTQNKVVGPSVDLDQAEMERVPEPKAYAAWKKDQRGKLKAAKLEHASKSGGDCGCGDTPAVMAMEEAAYDGPHLKMVRSGRVASATLVHIPAFAELSGHAKLTASAEPGTKIENDDVDTPEQDEDENREGREKMAALMAGAAPTAPPKEWFDDPKLTGPTPLHIDDDGRVYGHVAVWDTCHVGIGDSCVRPPKSLTSYAYFHTGEVTTTGGRVAVGRLTYGGGHAQPNLGYRAAAEHYDQTSATGALVRAGEDEYGIWVAGALTPDVDEAGVRAMRSAPLSGDWRRIGGNLEMVAALHVNTAGFPIPRMLVASVITGMPEDEEMLSLVAAGAIGHDHEDKGSTMTAGLDTDALGRAIARGMLAEQQEVARLQALAAEQEAQAVEWRELVAAATADDHLADYDDTVRDLFIALAQE